MKTFANPSHAYIYDDMEAIVKDGHFDVIDWQAYNQRVVCTLNTGIIRVIDGDEYTNVTDHAANLTLNGLGDWDYTVIYCVVKLIGINNFAA